MSKRAKEQVITREIDPNSWMVTFSDLLTLLLTFFVLLLTMSSMDVKKLTESFGQITPSPSVFTDTGSSNMMQPNIVPQVGEDPASGTGESEIATDVEAYQELLRLLDVLSETDDRITIYDSDEGLVVRFGADFLFESNTDQLTPQALQTLEQIAPVLSRVAAINIPMKIEGHSSTPSGANANPDAEMSLSIRRAHAVLLKITRDVDTPVPERVLTMVGCGAHQPALDTDSPIEGATLPPSDPRNRRVEIIINTRLRSFQL